jgi:hypothetical protein
MVAENCTAGEVPGGAIEEAEGRGERFAFEGPERRGGKLGVSVESKALGVGGECDKDVVGSSVAWCIGAKTDPEATKGVSILFGRGEEEEGEKGKVPCCSCFL